MLPIAAGDQGSDAVPEVDGAAAEGRRAKRQRVLKRAQLVVGFSGSTFDCLIIDETPFGILLETPLMMMHVPELVKLRFVDGTTFEARRRWSVGNKIGLEFAGSQAFEGTATFEGAILAQRRAAGEVLRRQGLTAAVCLLREAGFFQSAELQSAAEAAGIALARLEAMLV
jgi:hypothetical protein